MLQYGNKLEVIKRLLEVVDYIENNQNSDDMQVYKKIILKLSSTMINATISQSETIQTEDCDCNEGSCCTEQTIETPQYNLQETIDKIKTELKENE